MTTSEVQREAIKARSLRRNKAKIPSPLKKPPAPHSIHYIISKDLGTMLAYTRHPTRDAQGLSGKAFSAIDKNEQLLDNLKITFLSHRRSDNSVLEPKDADPPQQTEIANARALATQDRFPWIMMVRLVADSEPIWDLGSHQGSLR